MKKRYIIFFVLITTLIVIVIGYFGGVGVYKKQLEKEYKIANINDFWQQENYKKVIELSDDYLLEYPFNNKILLLNGYSLFNLAYLGTHNKSTIDVQMIWASIYSIRKVLTMTIDSQLRNSAYYVLGKCYYILSGKYLEQSIAYLQKSIYNKYIPDDIYEFLSAALWENNKVDECIVLLQRVLQSAPKLSLYLALIDIYLEQSDIENSRNMLREAKIFAQTKQENIAVEIRDARVYLQQDNISKAIEKFSDIIAVFPRSVEAHYYLGNAYELLGDKTKARYEWRLAHKISPDWDKVIAKLDTDINY